MGDILYVIKQSDEIGSKYIGPSRVIITFFLPIYVAYVRSMYAARKIDNVQE